MDGEVQLVGVRLKIVSATCHNETHRFIFTIFQIRPISPFYSRYSPFIKHYVLNAAFYQLTITNIETLKAITELTDI